MKSPNRSPIKPPSSRPPYGKKIFWDFLLIGVLAVSGFYLLGRIRLQQPYPWNWKQMGPFFFFREKGHLYAGLLLRGLFLTLKISFYAFLVALLVGIPLGIARSAKLYLLRFLSGLYVEFFRNTPPLVILFINYYFISDIVFKLLGFDALPASLPENLKFFLSIPFSKPELLRVFLAGVFSLGLYEGAFVAEIIRAGLRSLPRGQAESSEALGLSGFQKYRLVLLPQTVKKNLPPLAGQAVSTLKDSSIISAVSIPELTLQSNNILQTTGSIYEVWIITALIYFVVAYGIASLFEFFYRRSLRSGTP